MCHPGILLVGFVGANRHHKTAKPWERRQPDGFKRIGSILPEQKPAGCRRSRGSIRTFKSRHTGGFNESCNQLLASGFVRIFAEFAHEFNFFLRHFFVLTLLVANVLILDLICKRGLCSFLIFSRSFSLLLLALLSG